MSKYIFCGDNGTIIQRSNAGVYTARTSGVSASLRYITRSPDGALYVGGVETLLRSINGGTSWEDISSLTTWTASEFVRQIHVFDASNIYIATTWRILHYDGVNTITQMKDNTGILSFGGWTGVWAFTPDDVWAVCRAYRTQATWHWNGSAWTTGYTQWQQGGRLFGVGGLLRTSGFYNSSDAAVLRWNGSGWSYDKQYAASSYADITPYWGVHGSAADNVISWIQGTLSRMYMVRWNGSSWSAQTQIRDGYADGVTIRCGHTNGPADSALACTQGHVMIQTAAPETWVEETDATTGTTEHLYGVVGLAGPTITGIDHEVLSDAGGELVTVSGLFEVGETFSCYLGPNGDATDTPVRFAGLAKGATLDVVSDTTLQIVTPPITKGVNQLTLVDSGGQSGSYAVNVVERSWPAATFRMRRGFDATMATGPRTLRGEPER